MNEEPAPQIQRNNLSLRYAEIGLVLLVAFTPYFIKSIAVYLQPPDSIDVPQLQVSLFTAIAHDLCALLVMRYVLFRQGKGWRAVGVGFELMDVLKGIGLLLLTWIASFGVAMLAKPIGGLFHLQPHFVDARRLLWAEHISVLVVIYGFVNPFFEELIVRGFLMSQLLDLGKKPVFVFLVSVAIQSAYHIYQGWSNMLLLSVSFMVLSVYFIRTRKIAPIIIAHLATDLLSLIPRH